MLAPSWEKAPGSVFGYPVSQHLVAVSMSPQRVQEEKRLCPYLLRCCVIGCFYFKVTQIKPSCTTLKKFRLLCTIIQAFHGACMQCHCKHRLSSVAKCL